MTCPTCEIPVRDQRQLEHHQALAHRPILPLPPHQHEWQPAAEHWDDMQMSVIIVCLCKCGELTTRQWDF